MITGSVTTTQNVNTPAISSTTTALAANQARIGWVIQNMSTNPMYLLQGSGVSTSIFHTVLKGGTTLDDGTGAIFSQTQGVIYNGIVSVTNATGIARYTVIEYAP